MNGAHSHLLVNHIPIIAPFVGLLVLIAAMVMKSEVVKRTAFAIVVLGAISSFPAGVTGESAEEYLEEISDADHVLIHEHEEAAEVFITFSYLSGALAAFAFWASYKEKTYAKFLPLVVLVILLAVLFTSYNTGVTGGEIIHTEIR